MMVRRYLAAAVAIAVCTHGTTRANLALTSSYATWAANAGGVVTNTTTDPNYATSGIFNATTSSIGLNDGGMLTTGDSVSIYRANADWGPWTNARGASYGGIVYDTTDATQTPSNTVTIGLPSWYSVFALELQPDTPSAGTDTFDISVTGPSGTTTTSITEDFNTIGTTAFVGYYGGSASSITITLESGSDFAFGDFLDVPEPASLALLVSGLSLLSAVRRRTGGRRPIATAGEV